MSKADLHEKHKVILAQERMWAHAVARNAVKARPISVWEVMIPVLLIFSYMHSKSGKDVFVQNLLFTKELALKASLEMERNGRDRKEALRAVEEKTRALLTSVQEGIYSEEIRHKQLKEIHLLLDHYRVLLNTEAGDYGALIVGAYKQIEPYRHFLDQLSKAEKEVHQAALKTLGEKGDPALVSRMEACMDGFRKDAALRIFGNTS
ncbi:MAG: NF038143 family protein [Pseudomonadota bacterium]